MTTYYFTAASKQFLLEEEPVEEILRERLNFYKDQNIPIDFWLALDPTLINKLGLSFDKNFLSSDLAAIISTNPTFINWLKLRLQYVVTGNIQIANNSPELKKLINTKNYNYDL